jgi:hypothetical protein
MLLYVLFLLPWPSFKHPHQHHNHDETANTHHEKECRNGLTHVVPLPIHSYYLLGPLRFQHIQRFLYGFI